MTERQTIGWQPIETAPRRTEVLVWDGCAVSVGIRTECESFGSDDGWGWKALACGITVDEAEGIDRSLEPRRWMPLPEPPHD